MLNYKHLSRISVRGFKSIEKCDLELKSINVLIGSNGAGKSNFISVFTLLHNILVKNLAVYTGQSGINSLFYNGIKATDEIYMEFFFGLNSYGFELTPTDDNGIIFKKEFFGYYGNFEHESNLPRGNRESMWDSENKNRIFDYVKPILENQCWRVYHFHDTGKTAKVKSEHNISNNKTLLFDAANLAAFLYRLREYYKEDYRKILNIIKMIAAYFDDFELSPNEGDNEKIVLKWRQKGSDDIFNASQLSDGTLRFICLMTLLLQPAELRPATIIIDEPELGLHPYAITIFAETVREISAVNQIIISTQSVELLNEFEADDVIVAERNESGSVFKRLSAEELSEWLEYDYTLGELWNKNILGGRLSASPRQE